MKTSLPLCLYSRGCGPSHSDGVLRDQMETRAELLTRALCETLDSILSPTARDALLSEALALSGRSEIPLEPTAFRAFLAGPLASALERTLGVKLGGSVAAELERATARLLPRPALTPERAPGS